MSVYQACLDEFLKIAKELSSMKEAGAGRDFLRGADRVITDNRFEHAVKGMFRGDRKAESAGHVAATVAKAGLPLGVGAAMGRHSKKKNEVEKKAMEVPQPGFIRRLVSDPGGHKTEIAGLGMLAALPADQLQAHLRSKKGENWEHKSLLGGEAGHAVGDIAGLGVLAAPSIRHLVHGT